MSGHLQGFESDLQLRDQSIKESACNAGGPGSIPGLGRSSAEGNGNPLQYSCLDNPMDGGVWWALWCHKELNMTERLSIHSHCLHIPE